MSKIYPQPDVIFQNLEGETVLLNLKTEQYYSLGEVSSRMWSLLIEFGEAEPVINRMLAEYNVDETVIKSDLNELIADCCELGLLYVAP